MAEWTTVTRLQTLQANGRCLARLGSVDLALFYIDGAIHAIEDTCPHAGASLCWGPLNGHQVQCRAHGLRFSLRTGAMAGAAGLTIEVFPVRVVGEDVQVQLASALDELPSTEPRRPG